MILTAPLTRFRLSARACPGPASEFSTHFSDAPADHSPDVLAVDFCAAPTTADTPSLPVHGPRFVEGTITLDDAFSTTKITVHSATTASTVSGCVALLDAAPPQTFIRRDVLEQMLGVARPPLIASRALPRPDPTRPVIFQTPPEPTPHDPRDFDNILT